METANYHIYGMGLGDDDLRYIGWTCKSVDNEQEQICSDVTQNGRRDIAEWAKQALHCGKLSIFEIETAPSAESAKDSAMFWCEYYRWLGLDVDYA